MPSIDRRWRHRFQILRWTGDGSYEVLSSHRFEVIASWWAALRQAFNPTPGVWLDVRATPDRKDAK